tara:strand:- start:1265 stop:1591 length:327 start_codon:yes stop_codon:yes gene_type:complete
MKIVVSGKVGIGKTSLIGALRSEAPDNDYDERHDCISDLEALGLASEEDCVVVHLVEDGESVLGQHTEHAHICMSIYRMSAPNDEGDVWKDRARTVLAWIRNNRGEEE